MKVGFLRPQFSAGWNNRGNWPAPLCSTPAVTHLVFLWPTTLLLGFGFQLSYLVENPGEEQAAGWGGAQKCQHWINARWTPALTPRVVGAGACSPLNVSCPPGSILSKSGHMTQAPEEPWPFQTLSLLLPQPSRASVKTARAALCPLNLDVSPTGSSSLGFRHQVQVNGEARITGPVRGGRARPRRQAFGPQNLHIPDPTLNAASTLLPVGVLSSLATWRTLLVLECLVTHLQRRKLERTRRTEDRVASESPARGSLGALGLHLDFRRNQAAMPCSLAIQI